ncbi:MAG: hypothetical protein U0610_07310 [bacterium]
MRSIELAELAELEVLRAERTEDWYPKVHRIFRTHDDLLVKRVDLRPAHVDYYLERLLVAGEAPCAEPIEALVVEHGRFCGWAERYLPNLVPFRYFEAERDVFRAHCARQQYLAQRGYFDLDAATINYARRADGSVFTFDKDAVFRLDSLEPCQAAFDEIGESPFWKLHGGTYFVLLRQSYRTLPDALLTDISHAFASGQRRRIVAAFAAAAASV